MCILYQKSYNFHECVELRSNLLSPSIVALMSSAQPITLKLFRIFPSCFDSLDSVEGVLDSSWR